MNTIPNEMLLYITTFVEDEDLATMRTVCKGWHELIDAHAWKFRCEDAQLSVQNGKFKEEFFSWKKRRNIVFNWTLKLCKHEGEKAAQIVEKFFQKRGDSSKEGCLQVDGKLRFTLVSVGCVLGLSDFYLLINDGKRQKKLPLGCGMYTSGSGFEMRGLEVIWVSRREDYCATWHFES